MIEFSQFDVLWVKADHIYDYSNRTTSAVYAFAWCENKPKSTQWPSEIEDTFYIGMSGGLTDDFIGDKKNKNKSKVTSTTRVHIRMKTHMRYFKNKDSNFKGEENKYNLYHETYDSFTTFGKTLYVCLLRPKSHIKKFGMRCLLSATESLQIWQYMQRFDKRPLLNLAEDDDIGSETRVSNSHSQKHVYSITHNTLNDFFMDNHA
jgi:hypothetical protein